MTDADLSEFCEAISRAFVAYGRPAPEVDQMDGMFDALAIFPLADVRRACSTAVRELKYPPNAAELTKIIRSARQSLSRAGKADRVPCAYRSKQHGQCPFRGYYPQDEAHPDGPRLCPEHEQSRGFEDSEAIVERAAKRREEAPPPLSVTLHALRHCQQNGPEDTARVWGKRAARFVERHADENPTAETMRSLHARLTGAGTPAKGGNARRQVRDNRTAALGHLFGTHRGGTWQP